MEETQGKYRIREMVYTPVYYGQAGMRIVLEIEESRPRTVCPLCGKFPNVHGYIKNDKIRSAQRGTGDNGIVAQPIYL